MRNDRFLERSFLFNFKTFKPSTPLGLNPLLRSHVGGSTVKVITSIAYD